ncbi:ParB/Srx family N-terminal domain-containing protein [Erwinia sp. HR93]|uniref:ParB/Srx family N-terminal domain-containing protein n=1 Tax=Erwinia sp. HR93 TaxID=3094840 RepID=UPI002ADEBCF5|nr:ParB/Srx family N-terminal domain-containing protein [Erwinia sp. HR93]MEA1064731.1 ParB/Srx family N-terminal domain-containing protein [Erwinia sp. HR93]
MQKLEIVYRQLTELTQYARNARTHDKAQVGQLIASIREFGWTNPVLVDENGVIIAGHGRVMAAEEMGMDTVPCITLAGLTGAQKRAYRLADNRLPLNAGWNEELLALEVETLQDEGFNIDLLGFNDYELSKIFETEADNPADHWIGMPDFDQSDANGVRQLIVHFETDADVKNFAELVGAKITDKTKYIWYPPKEREDKKSKVYASDES